MATNAQKEIEKRAAEIEARAKAKMLAEAEAEYNLQRSAEYRIALNEKYRIEKKLKTPIDIPLTPVEANLLNHAVDLIKSCNELCAKLNSLDENIQQLTRDISSVEYHIESTINAANQAVRKFRTEAIPALMALKIHAEPTRAYNNSHNPISVFPDNKAAAEFKKEFDSYSDKVAAAEKEKENLVYLKAKLEENNKQREFTFDTLKNTMAELKKTLPKLKALPDAYEAAFAKHKAEVEKELADYDAYLQKEFRD